MSVLIISFVEKKPAIRWNDKMTSMEEMLFHEEWRAGMKRAIKRKIVQPQNLTLDYQLFACAKA